MENEIVNISLTVLEWNQILGALSTAPFQVVNTASAAINNLQTQAGPQIEAAAAKYPAPEAAAAE